MRFRHLLAKAIAREVAMAAVVLVGTPFGQIAWSQSWGGPVRWDTPLAEE